MENKIIKLKMTTVSSANPVSVIKGKADYTKKDGRVLIVHTDEENVRTALIITDEKVVLSRRTDLYSYKIPIKQGETLKGMIGDENTFLVVGKRFETVNDNGEIHHFLEYDLPDLSDEPASFCVEIEYNL